MLDITSDLMIGYVSGVILGVILANTKSLSLVGDTSSIEAYRKFGFWQWFLFTFHAWLSSFLLLNLVNVVFMFLELIFRLLSKLF